MPDYFLVTFGHGVGACLPRSLADAAEDLRRLIDNACGATFGAFPADVLVSVAPSATSRSFCLVVITQFDARPSQTEVKNFSDDFNVTMH